MYILRILEYGVGRLLFNFKGHDDNLFFKGPAFAEFPEPTIVVDSEVGPSNSHFTIEYTGLGENKFPELKWSPPASVLSEVEEFILVKEDPDAPISTPPIHGLYYGIPATKTGITAEDLQIDESKTEGGMKWLKGGFRLGKNVRGKIYLGPRPPCGHGPHRYFFEVVALKEKLDVSKLSAVATRKELEEAIKGKVIGWGAWVGVFDNVWE